MFEASLLAHARQARLAHPAGSPPMPLPALAQAVEAERRRKAAEVARQAARPPR